MRKYLQRVSVDSLRKTIANLSKRGRRLRPKYPEPIAKSLIVIDEVLKDAHDLKVESEVVMFAMMHIRDNPSATISEAIILGYEQWVR